MINIGNSRELFFDDYLLDTEKTTAERRLHRPIRKGEIFKLDMPWEGNVCGYFSVFLAEGKYRMYYRATQSGRRERYICYAESDDGISWVRPNLGIVEINGSKDNNVLMDLEMLFEMGFKTFDNLSVFYDENPECPSDRKYKMLCMYCGNGALLSLVSEDGIHFRKDEIITRDGEFDSQNLAFWSKYYGKYFCYYRGEHEPKENVRTMDKSYTDKVAKELLDPEKMLLREPGNGDFAFMRDIRVIESPDYKNWSSQKLINYTGEDLQPYTSGIIPYPRAENIFVGLSARYVERKAWTPNYDELCGREERLARMSGESLRTGLAITDGMLLVSRDGYNFTKFDEAFLCPPPENSDSFVYGDGFCTPTLIETSSDVSGAENEYMLHVLEGYRSNRGYCSIVKYALRLDGFVSLHAGGTEKNIVTKEFTYDGDNLYCNIESSARGSVYFTLKCGDEEYTSYETFGNSADKRVHFTCEDAVKRCKGKPVVLEAKIYDCDLYAIKFDR